MDFGENLKIAMIKSGNKNSKVFAEKLGIKYSTFLSYTTQGREPKYATLVKIADLLHTSVDSLLGHTKKDNIIDIFKRAGLIVEKAKKPGRINVYYNGGGPLALDAPIDIIGRIYESIVKAQRTQTENIFIDTVAAAFSDSSYEDFEVLEDE